MCDLYIDSPIVQPASARIAQNRATVHFPRMDVPSAQQCRAARALLNLSREWLAKRSGVSRRAIANFESGASGSLMPMNARAIRETFEREGIEFSEDGKGVSLTK